jgi:hypothetical protein
MSKLTRALEELAKRADAGDEASLMFLHNTTANKLERIQSMGGMPMPSIAITDKDIPFEGFGDITLVGKPESFDPKANSLNQAFSADAYTIRAPRPLRIAKKGAGKKFRDLYGYDAKALDVYADQTVANVWDLEKKGEADGDKFDQVVGWFDRWAGPIFLKRKGIEFNKEDGREIYDKLQPFRQSGEFKQWADDAVDELFEPDEYFVANPDRDYYTQKPKLKPYTADEILKVMRRSGGRGGEGGMATGTSGSVRAAYTDKLTSLDAMRKRKDQLRGDIAIEKEEITNLLGDLGDALKPYYKYDPNGWSYRDAVSELMTEGATRGLKRSADFVGFENIPKDLMSELEGFQQILKKAPTEYFESKPQRVVKLNEFAGAIVPEGTSQSTIDLLTKQGLEIEQYADDAQRLEARKKFKKLLFQLPPVIATTIAGAVAAGSAPEAQAGPGSRALAELAKRADAGDEVARQGIRAYHGSPHDFPPVRELEMPDGAVVYQHMDDAVPEGARVIAEHPLGRFDMSKLGTGEGNQMYGNGLYFAEAEAVAKGYRQRSGVQSGFGNYAITDSVARNIRKRMTEADESGNYLAAGAIDELLTGDFSPDQIRRTLQEDLDVEGLDPTATLKLFDDAVQEARSFKGSMYQVDINATPDEFLDWDKPLSEQPNILEKLRSYVDAKKAEKGGYIYLTDDYTQSLYEMLKYPEDVKGFEVYSDFQDRTKGSFQGAESKSSKATSIIADAGIKGIKYLDEGSRAAGKGTSNYVVFDDKLISIAKKYGISIPAAAAIAAGTMTPEEAQAGPVSKALVDLAKRAVAGDTDAATEIAKYGGAGRILDQFGDPRSMDMSNLDQVPNVQQFGLERYNPPRGRPANLDPLLTDEAAQRMEGFARRGENRGGRAWYNTQPLRDEFISELGESEGAAAFDRYMDIVAATSPRSRVDANIRRSSYLYGEDRAGRPIAGLTNADFPPGYGHLAHLTQDASLKDLEGGRSFQSLDRPKTSSFAENLKGNQQPMTIDTHNFSAITGDNKNKKSPSGTQYKYLEDFQVEIANKLNMTPAQFQASVWMGAETGVADARPFLEVFDDVVARTAKRNDVSKQKALTDFIRGDAPLYGLAAVMTGGAIVPQDAQASEYPSLGGMGVRMPPTAEDEEAMLAPTGGDLMQQANRDFAGAIRTQPEPDFLTSVQQSLLSGIMKTAGVADLSADVVSAMAGPLLSAPGAIARYAADRYVPGVNYTAEEMAQGRRETEDYFNYQPRTEQGQQYGEQIMQGIGGAIAPYVPAIKKAAGDSYILGAMRQGYDYLGEREKELAKALMDLSPI